MALRSLILSAAFVLLLGAAPVASAGDNPATVETAGGATRVGFNRPAGRVTVYLPDDIRPGDTISGTVVASPAGRDQGQVERNGDTLNGYVIDVGGTRAPVANGLFKLVVPAGIAALPFILLDGRRTIGRTSVPVTPGAPPVQPEAPDLPLQSQAGRPLEIQGPFDGDASNTQVNVGGAPVVVLAESPRVAVLTAPIEPVGPVQIILQERQTRTTGTMRNIGVMLSAPKTTLVSGEQTTLHIEVTGLSGLTSPLPLGLAAAGPVQLRGGNTQIIMIQPGQVDPQGRFTVDLGLQATAAGGFDVTATLGDAPAP